MVMARRRRLRAREYWIGHFYGPKKANRLLLIEGRTPLKPQELELMAGRMVRRLAEVELPPVEGCKLDPVTWSNRLRPAWKRLHDVIDELALRRSPLGSPLRRWPRR